MISAYAKRLLIDLTLYFHASQISYLIKTFAKYIQVNKSRYNTMHLRFPPILASSKQLPIIKTACF